MCKQGTPDISMRAAAWLKNKTREKGAGRGERREKALPRKGHKLEKLVRRCRSLGERERGGGGLPAGDRKSHRELSYVPSSANACC